MNLLSKVVWSEGMYLGPHHFQAQNRNFEDVLRLDHLSLWFQPYGFSGLRLDADAIRNGTVAVLYARGLFTDGLAFDFPGSDSTPKPFAIEEYFSPIEDSLNIYLAVPLRREGGRNCLLPGENPDTTRYVAEPVMLPDENTGTDERAIYVGRKNLRIVAEPQVTADMSTLPLARIRRDGSGHFQYDPVFIPPCTRSSGSDALMSLVGTLLELLQEKSASLQAPFPGSGSEFSPRQVASFWFSHALNSTLAPLRHLWASKQSHPEELYLELSRLAGALCTFSLDATPSTLPLYQHDDLATCFEALNVHIRRHLELVLPTNCLTFRLKRSAEFFETPIADSRCFGSSQWILAVRAQAAPADVISYVPQAKVCSSRFVGELVRRALPGLVLTHLPVTPSAVPRRADTQYFSIVKSGRCWDHLLETRLLGVHVPGELADPQVDLHVILDQN